MVHRVLTENLSRLLSPSSPLLTVMPPEPGCSLSEPHCLVPGLFQQPPDASPASSLAFCSPFSTQQPVILLKHKQDQSLPCFKPSKGLPSLRMKSRTFAVASKTLPALAPVGLPFDTSPNILTLVTLSRASWPPCQAGRGHIRAAPTSRPLPLSSPLPGHSLPRYFPGWILFTTQFFTEPSTPQRGPPWLPWPKN